MILVETNAFAQDYILDDIFSTDSHIQKIYIISSQLYTLVEKVHPDITFIHPQSVTTS